VSDAVAHLGSAEKIREVFVGFQKHLYASDETPGANPNG
jgi:hypothetical protein